LIKGNIILKLNGNHNEIKIGNDFLADCERLENVDFGVLRKVKSIGDFFLAGCVLLEKVDLSGLYEVKSIGNFFLLLSQIKGNRFE
jgi:hypothetical protein